LEVRDDAGDSSKAIAAGHELIDKLHVPAIVGATFSSVTISLAGVTAPNTVVLMSASSTSPEISALADGGFVFRTVATDTLQRQGLAKLAHAHGFTRVGVIYEPDAYGRGLGYAFAIGFLQQGGTVTDIFAYPLSAASYAPLLGRVYQKAPEAILLVAK